MEFLVEYGLFLAKTITLIVGVLLVIIVALGLSHKSRTSEAGHIQVTNINEKFDNITQTLKQVVMEADALKAEQKEEKKAEKKRLKNAKKEKAHDEEGDPERKKRVYVLDFEGDVQASAVSQLREEVTAVLSIAEALDEVVLRLESPGGVVHGYGLAASQLSRIVNKNIRLTIAVDKVAASGGYMMACIADNLIAAPFAILGSIGVVAQIPNFHRLLKKKDVDVEILTAGDYKRTLTMFGENTEKGRQKFVEELEDVHRLFKDFVTENRPIVDAEAVGTGEAWYGKRALENKLVDALETSDTYIFEQSQIADVYLVKYVEDKSKMDKILDRMTTVLTKFSGREDLQFQGRHIF